MGIVTCNISISLDGFVAGPDQSLDDPLGQGGMRLHQWVFNTASWRRRQGSEGGEDTADSEIVETQSAGTGAYIMGRNMFGPGRGRWDMDWSGWWGEEPPYHAPVFVLTHFPREPLKMLGGTTFNFVTQGIEAALHEAKSVAGDGNIQIAGGASTVRQYLAAGLLDELHLHIVPVVLGRGERLLDDVGDPILEPVNVVASPAVTHVRYRVVHPA
ncbi:MAG TPA: dihydrofolate reductase family protein [Candidatus Dormibacteraeota bacterium]|jgi:dihydrofolate reductase